MNGGIDVSTNSDGYTGRVVKWTGYEKILAIVTTETPSTSAATLTFSFQKNVVTDVATDAASTDWIVFGSDCSVVAATYAASTSVYVGAVDITIPSSDTAGLIRCSVLTPGEGLTIDGLAVTYFLYGGQEALPTTDWQPVYWPVPA